MAKNLNCKYFALSQILAVDASLILHLILQYTPPGVVFARSAQALRAFFILTYLGTKSAAQIQIVSILTVRRLVGLGKVFYIQCKGITRTAVLKEQDMKKLFTLIAGAAVLGAGLLAASPAAMARDRVDWSVSVGSGGYGYPAPVVIAPPPPVVVAPPVVYAPPPVVVQRPVPMVGYSPYYYSPPPGHWRGRGWGHHHHEHWDGGRRYDR